MQLVRRATTRAVQVAAMTAGLGLASCTPAWAVAPPLGGFEASAGGTTAHSQGYLGVDIRDVNDAELAALKLKEPRGAEVIRVDHDGPAGKAGLREQDVILQMNGTAIEGQDQLRRMLRDTPAGRTVTLILSRAGQLLTVTTSLANRLEVEREAREQRWVVPMPTEDSGASTAAATAPAAPANAANAKAEGSSGSTPKGTGFFSAATATRSEKAIMGALTPGSSYTGAMVETMGPQLAEFFGASGGGVLVHSVDASSPAAAAGLRAGDVVLRANSVKMATSSDWMKVVRENRGKTVEVVVLRDKQEQTLKLIPDSKKHSSVQKPNWDDPSDPVMLAHMNFSFR
jgi:serine protease Do